MRALAGEISEMSNQDQLRPTPAPVLPEPPRGAGLYGEVAPLPVNRVVPPPPGESRTFL